MLTFGGLGMDVCSFVALINRKSGNGWVDLSDCDGGTTTIDCLGSMVMKAQHQLSGLEVSGGLELC